MGFLSIRLFCHGKKTLPSSEEGGAPNKVVYEWLTAHNYDYIKPEYTYGNSRIDFYMEKGEEKFLM